MKLDLLQKYLIAINIFSFGLFTVAYVKFLLTGDDDRWHLLENLVTVFGGSFGTLLAFFLWNRAIAKRNIAYRVFTVCMVIIHIAILLSIYGVLDGRIQWNGFSNLKNGLVVFASTHKWLWYYLLVINMISFVAFVADKIRAIEGRWRIRELSLLAISFIGGAIGGLIAMYTTRHKVHSPQFSRGLPLIIVAQIALLLYWIACTI